MNHITKYIFAILSLIMLTGCSESEKNEVRPMDTLAPISLTLSVPADKTETRIGDPGEDTNDKVDWDRLTIIVAYKEKTQGDEIHDAAPQKMVYYDTYTKEEFDRGKLVTHSTSTLSGPDANGFRTYTMYLPLGTCCVYGVTYSSGQGLDLEGELNKITEDGTNGNEHIYNLQISNDYAHKDGAVDIAKFISVATGYALKLDSETQILTDEREIKVEQNINTNINTKQYWRMVLGRLAAKIDIQWDAKGAYEKGEDGKQKFTNVKVQSFTYHGEPTGTTVSGSGYGRLFPTLYHQEVSSKTSVSGYTTFLNTSEISKRNGRVYHYTFPDGTNPPHITFQLDTKKEGTTGNKIYNVTFDMSNLKDGFIPARWYKINARISGSKLGEEPNITINKFYI
ncbi:hypothetical protein V7T09_12345 [Segatella copri]|uniref:hypothetical protein n=1 Tax=Segatella copri TaxID=165179 RepID=UPI001C44E7D4|nr:hypothetical protein [Segatella copri]MBW0022431.1 hypothetical protein [Segatella copri]MBW0037895.1 hypothetical protein [Segatella copri]